MDAALLLQVARTVVGRYCRNGLPPHVDRQDLIQAAALRLCKDVPRLPTHHQQTFAYGVAKWAIQDELRRAGTPIELDVEGMADDGDGPYEHVLAKEEAAELISAVNRLSCRQHRVMNAVLFDQPLNELAEEMGVSPSAVSQIKRSAMRNLKTRLRARGIHR